MVLKGNNICMEDLIEAMILVANQENKENYFDDDIYNIGPNDSELQVKEIAEMTIKYQSPNAKIIYGSDPQGWVGDVLEIFIQYI